MNLWCKEMESGRKWSGTGKPMGLRGVNVELFKREQRACVHKTAMFNSSPLPL